MFKFLWIALMYLIEFWAFNACAAQSTNIPKLFQDTRLILSGERAPKLQAEGVAGTQKYVSTQDHDKIKTDSLKEEGYRTLVVALNADYPPFEFIQNNKVVGFDIDLAKSIGKIIGYNIEIKDMSFDSIISSLRTGRADMGISAMTITSDRLKNVDFSERYYVPKLAMLYMSKAPIKTIDDLPGKKIATQLGTTMETFLRDQIKSGKQFNLVVWKKTHVMVKELKLGRIDGALIEETQAKTYTKMHPEMSYSILPSDEYVLGYAIALKKDSTLKAEVNAAIKKMKASGALSKLENAWLGAGKSMAG